MLLVWILSGLMLVVSGVYYLKSENSREYMSPLARDYSACLDVWMKNIPDCNIADEAGSELHHLRCKSQGDAVCISGGYSNRALEAMRNEINISWLWTYLAIITFISSIALFYGARWGITGKIRAIK